MQLSLTSVYNLLNNLVYGEKDAKISSLTETVSDLNEKLSALTEEKSNLESTLKVITDDIDALRTMTDEQITELKTQIERLTEPSELEETLNSKYPKKVTLYSARTLYNKSLKIDPRGFFVNPNTKELTDIVQDWKSLSDDAKAWNCFKWVKSNITYTSDKLTSGYNEMWYYPQETLGIKRGDCEDMHILLANLMLASGVPYYKIRLVCGDVYNTKGELEGGHCWLVYYVESLGYWVALDTCFYSSSTPLLKRTDYKKSSIYGGDDSIWFSWNQKYMFKK